MNPFSLDELLASTPTLKTLTVERHVGAATGTQCWFVYVGDKRRYALQFSSEHRALEEADRIMFREDIGILLRVD